MPMPNDYFPPDMKIEDWAEQYEHREVTASSVPEVNHSRSMARGVVVVGHDDTHWLAVEVEERCRIVKSLPFHCRYHAQVAT